MRYEIRNLKRHERGNAPFLYWECHYFEDGADVPFAINDFLAGDMLRWIGAPITEKITRVNPDTGVPEFLSADTGEWVTRAEKYAEKVVDGKSVLVRVHRPARRVVGTYTEDMVPGWIQAQCEKWIADHPSASGDRRDRALMGQRPLLEPPAPVRNMSKTVDIPLQRVTA